MTDETTPSPIVTIDDTPIGQCVGPLSFFEPKPLFTFHGGGTTVARLGCVDGRWRFSLGEGVEVDDAARGMLEALGSMMPRAPSPPSPPSPPAHTYDPADIDRFHLERDTLAGFGDWEKTGR